MWKWCSINDGEKKIILSNYCADAISIFIDGITMVYGTVYIRCKLIRAVKRTSEFISSIRTSSANQMHINTYLVNILRITLLLFSICCFNQIKNGCSTMSHACQTMTIELKRDHLITVRYRICVILFKSIQYFSGLNALILCVLTLEF